MELEHIDNGNAFDWGKASEDYAKYRDIYTDTFYQKIIELGLCKENHRVLDLGTGTGVLPRHLFKYGAKFVGVDISENQIAQARRLSEGMDIEYIVSPAEEVDFSNFTFDAVLACQCFIYFDAQILMPRLYRMLKDNGKICIMSLMWIPGESKIAEGSEELVLKHNPYWNGSGFIRPTFEETKLPQGIQLAMTSGFELDEHFAFDIPVTFTRESWHGRIRACRGIGASSLTPEQITAFEDEHLRFLDKQPEVFEISHSAIFIVLKKI